MLFLWSFGFELKQLNDINLLTALDRVFQQMVMQI